MSKKNKLKIIPLGGLGEVGKNMMAYEFAGEIIVVDAGIMFPKNDMLGVDYIIPDYEYLKKKANQVRALIITHGHEDHIGAIQHFIEDIPVPIYALLIHNCTDCGRYATLMYMANDDVIYDHQLLGSCSNFSIEW